MAPQVMRTAASTRLCSCARSDAYSITLLHWLNSQRRRDGTEATQRVPERCLADHLGSRTKSVVVASARVVVVAGLVLAATPAMSMIGGLLWHGKEDTPVAQAPVHAHTETKNSTTSAVAEPTPTTEPTRDPNALWIPYFNPPNAPGGFQ